MEREMRKDFRLTQALLAILASAFFAWAGVVWDMNSTLEDAFQKYQLTTLAKFGEVEKHLVEQSVQLKLLMQELGRHDNK